MNELSDSLKSVKVTVRKPVIALVTLINFNTLGKCFYITVLIVRDRASTSTLQLRTTLMGKIRLPKYDWGKKDRSYKKSKCV